MNSFSFLLVLAFVGSSSSSQNRAKRQGLHDVYLWDDKTLKYYYTDGFPFEFRAMFRDAFDYMSSHTCLRFEENENADHKVALALDERRCESAFGQRNSYQQTMRFAHTCAAFGVALHEMMHALGIAHTQSRSDRDKYIVVDSDDYNDDKEESTFNPVPFDYGSVMLYARDERRHPKDAEYNYTMGSLRVAFYDMILLNEFYDCKCDKKFEKLKCQNGGYQNPAKCDECICTDGFAGKLCDKFDPNALIFEATTEWDFARLYIKYMRGTYRNTMPITRYIIITAPPNSTIEAQITQLDGFFCHGTCDFNGVEIKYKEDRRITSPLVCCNDDNLWNVTRSTTNNPLVIAKYGEERGPFLRLRFRYIPGNTTQTTTESSNTTVSKVA